MLGHPCEGETGLPFPEYLTQAVFEPLGMRESSLPGPAGHGGQSSLTDLTLDVNGLICIATCKTKGFKYAMTIVGVCFCNSKPSMADYNPGV